MTVLDRISLVRGNIVHEDVDAIVNAANSSLLGGGGVDGAIHDAAGPELLAECRTLGGCPTGGAKITKGYRLKARHVIHTVGPRYSDAATSAPKLASAYRESMRVAAEHGIRSIAFPSVSTGIFGYPTAEAAPIALGTVAEELGGRASGVIVVRFVLFDDRTLAAYERALGALRHG